MAHNNNKQVTRQPNGANDACAHILLQFRSSYCGSSLYANIQGCTNGSKINVSLLVQQ